jgi:DNA invertase Pin-like site-specific DNA recombinase
MQTTPVPTLKRRTAIYARVSTATQESGLESQIRALRLFCDHNKIGDYELFADENQSGTKASRPGLDRMMKAVEAGEIDAVVVFAFSRFARSVSHMMKGLEIFKRHDTNFISLTEKIDTNSPIGKAVFVIISAIATLERDLICERVRNGLANARAKGKLIGRKKLRDSDLIRKLLKAGLSYRSVAKIAKCSHGSVHAEVLALKRDEAIANAKLEADKLAEEQLLTSQAKAVSESGIRFPEAA